MYKIASLFVKQMTPLNMFMRFTTFHIQAARYCSTPSLRNSIIVVLYFSDFSACNLTQEFRCIYADTRKH